MIGRIHAAAAHSWTIAAELGGRAGMAAGPTAMKLKLPELVTWIACSTARHPRISVRPGRRRRLRDVVQATPAHVAVDQQVRHPRRERERQVRGHDDFPSARPGSSR